MAIRYPDSAWGKEQILKQRRAGMERRLRKAGYRRAGFKTLWRGPDLELYEDMEAAFEHLERKEADRRARGR